MEHTVSAAKQADILANALPYLQALYGKTIVVQICASLLDEAACLADIARDITLLKLVGLNLLVVHGDTENGASPIAEANQAVVGHINRCGGNTVGLSGQDGQTVHVAQGARAGETAQITKVAPALLTLLQANDYIPVLMPLGVAPDGTVHTVDGSELAGQLAQAIKAEKLILLGKHATLSEKYAASAADMVTAGDMEKLLASHHAPDARELRCSLAAAVHAVKHGVNAAHLLDGRVVNALLFELLTPEGIGTLICSDQGPHFLADSSRYFTDGEFSLRSDFKTRKNLVVRF